MPEQKRGSDIDKAILDALREESRPMSTLEISRKTGVSWHPVTSHCLKLQMSERIRGFKIGRMNVWELSERSQGAPEDSMNKKVIEYA